MTFKLEQTEVTAPAAPDPVRRPARGAVHPPLARVRAWSVSSMPLLPLLALYTLLSLALHAAPNDEPSYLQYARHLSSHGFYAAGAWDYMWHGPGLPALLVPLVAIHAPLAVMRILAGPVVLFATVLVFHRLVRLSIGGERAPLLASYALGLYLPFLSVVEVIHVEPLAALCLTLAVFFLVRSFRGGRRDHLWGAVALAALALSRVEYGYVLLAALLVSGAWLLSSRRSVMARRSTLAAALALLLCTPWLAYTYAQTHKPFYWGNAGGLSLYWMSAPGNVGDWHRAGEAFRYPELAANRRVLEEVNRLKPLQQDARLIHYALQNIRRHPMHYVTNLGNNLARLLFNAPYSAANEQANGLSPPWGMLLYALPNALLLGLVAVAGFVAARVRRAIAPEVVPIAVLAGMAFAVHLPVAAYGRFLLPLVPLVAWLLVSVIAPHLRLSADPD
jgi:hypothetical protein